LRTLAIECATEACSIALFEDDILIAGAFEVMGRGHAERLVSMISELPDRGKAQHILVSLGPGSFTGLRVGLAAARALALAWRAECLGYPTLALVAAMASSRDPLTVCMSGGHGEWFVQDFGADGLPHTPLTSLAPDAAAARPGPALVAGSQSEALVARRGHGTSLAILPDAREALLVPQALVTSDLAPIYGRAPDAKLPDARQ